MEDEEQDAFLASLSSEERRRLREELELVGGDDGPAPGDTRADGSEVSGGRSAGARQSHAWSGGSASDLRSGKASLPGSIKQQHLRQKHQDAVGEAHELEQDGLDAPAQRYTGSDLRVKQQLGLAPTGERTHDIDHLDIPAPSEVEMAALVQLGYSRAQAALICMVDALTKEGYTPDEAQEHVTKAAARNIAGWYLESGAEAESRHHQDMREAPLPNPRAPPRALLPTSSLRARRPAPAHVDNDGKEEEVSGWHGEAGKGATLVAYAHLVRGKCESTCIPPHESK
jgi:hypothetical protein